MAKKNWEVMRFGEWIGLVEGADHTEATNAAKAKYGGDGLSISEVVAEVFIEPATVLVSLGPKNGFAANGGIARTATLDITDREGGLTYEVELMDVDVSDDARPVDVREALRRGPFKMYFGSCGEVELTVSGVDICERSPLAIQFVSGDIDPMTLRPIVLVADDGTTRIDNRTPRETQSAQRTYDRPMPTIEEHL